MVCIASPADLIGPEERRRWSCWEQEEQWGRAIVPIKDISARFPNSFYETVVAAGALLPLPHSLGEREHGPRRRS
jgi:hypothetical protein